MTTSPTVLPFRVRMVGLPGSRCGSRLQVEAGLQYGQEIVQSQPPEGEELIFSGELRLRSAVPHATEAPVFLGPYTHGPPSGRFLYISWTGEEGGVRSMFRRLKVQLGGISWAQIEEVSGHAGTALVATVHGRDGHGGPACATVPLVGGWRVEKIHSQDPEQRRSR